MDGTDFTKKRCTWRSLKNPAYIAYHDSDAFLQAIGIVNAHQKECFCYKGK